ncbi:MAG: ATP-dependent Clp protease ATP-binding subunit [Candidatus Moranbacteria bacterium]|jgi:ATP-dependent Clp protease ATP-binding subunit ClpC|nr:ATP-dependent Clp protease ATP-binding subunit [Candidatus Moranbacteria bacterium]
MLETTFSQKLTLHARHSLKEAREIAHYTKHASIEPEHLLLSIFLENGSLGSILLENIGFEKETLAKLCLKKKVGGKALPKTHPLPLSAALKESLRRAYALANQFHYPYVGTEHLVYALLETRSDAIDRIVTTLKIKEQKIQTTLESHLNFDHFPQLSKMFDLPDITQTETPKKGRKATPSLDQFTTDMSNDPGVSQNLLIGRKKELDRLMQILTRKNKNNPLLIGEPGVGKTALVAALAKKIARGDVPHSLFSKRILSLDLTLVVAGTNFRGEFEARLKDIIKEASHNKDVILFIDEIHTIVGAGNTSGGLDAANILKPALSRGEIVCIGATTLSEYKRHIEKDPALDRRFQSLLVTEPTAEETKHILSSVKNSYETFHNVTLTEPIIQLSVDLSIRHISDRFLPDKAFDIIDEASALAKHGKEKSPFASALFQLEEELRAATSLKESLSKHENYDDAAKWHQREQSLEKKIAALKAKHKEETGLHTKVVTTEHILQTVAHMTGIPFEKLSEEHPGEKFRLLKETLATRLIGQQEAALALEETLARSMSQISDPDRPLGSFLFLGPTGVGKTYIAKLLAEEFFGSKKALIRLDMSEFMERHSVAQILGAPAGYVGHGEGGKLTETVRRKPYSVVLFDEIEKAHPDVFNILLQILDEGTLTDAEGRSVSFKNTLVILTSNIGTAAFTQSTRIGFDKSSDNKQSQEAYEHLKRDVLGELKKELRPELLARLDQILVFRPLSQEAIGAIATQELERLKERLQTKGIALRFGKNIAAFIAEKSYAPEQGARLVRKNIQDLIEKPIALALIARHPATAKKKSLRLSLKKGIVLCS